MKTSFPKNFQKISRIFLLGNVIFFANLGNAFAEENAAGTPNSAGTPAAENASDALETSGTPPKRLEGLAEKLSPKMTNEKWAQLSQSERQAFEFQVSLRDFIKANIDGELILHNYIRRETQRGIAILQRDAKSEEEFYQKRSELLSDTARRFTEMYLLVAEFKAAGGLAMLSDDLVNERVNEVVERDFDGDRGKYLTYLRLSGSNPEREREKIRNTMIEQSQMWTLSQLAPVEISPMEVWRFYQQNLKNYQTTNRVEFAQIVIFAGAAQDDEGVEKSAKQLAEELRKTNDPDAFSRAAKIYSRDEFRGNGGYVGWRELDDLSALVVEKINSVKPGEVTDVLELSDGRGGKMFAIFRVIDRREAGLIPLDDVREQIENTLRNAAIVRIRSEKMEELWKKFFVLWY